MLQRMRASPDLKDVPVVIISGFGFEWEAELMGAQGYVGKPFAPEELQKTIATMKQSPRWQSTAACADATSPQSRQFCSAYRAAEAQLTSVPTDPDPQAALLAKLAGAMMATQARAAGAFAALPAQMAQLAEALRVKREAESGGGPEPD